MGRAVLRRSVSVLLIAGLFVSAVPVSQAAATTMHDDCGRPLHPCAKPTAVLSCCCDHQQDSRGIPAQTESRLSPIGPSELVNARSIWGIPVTAVPQVPISRTVSPRARSAPDRLALISTFLI